MFSMVIIQPNQYTLRLSRPSEASLISLAHFGVASRKITPGARR